MHGLFSEHTGSRREGQSVCRLVADRLALAPIGLLPLGGQGLMSVYRGCLRQHGRCGAYPKPTSRVGSSIAETRCPRRWTCSTWRATWLKHHNVSQPAEIEIDELYAGIAVKRGVSRFVADYHQATKPTNDFIESFTSALGQRRNLALCSTI